MTPQKRLFDLLTALLLTPIVLPVGLCVALAIWLIDGGPIFYRSERMRDTTTGFTFWKFRTMRPDPRDSGVTGADKAQRITKTGRFLRRTRLDELPQLINLWRGDLSLVGPRAPLRRYVERYPDIYREVLKSRPGITGLATITYGKHEEKLLARSQSSEETDLIYGRACVPRKAHIDLIYQKNQSICFDIWIALRTCFPIRRWRK